RRRPRAAKSLSRRVSYSCFFEQLEPRWVPSTLTSDKVAYAPTDVALFTAAGFQPGETVNLSVIGNNGSAYSATPVADGGPAALDGVANGSVTMRGVAPPDPPGNSYTATAVGASSGLTAQTNFAGLSTWVMANPKDYAPGQYANFYADGFLPGETVDFKVDNL